MADLRHVVDTFASGSRLRLDAGSVTPKRMAGLLSAAGVADTAGFAANVSSFAPNGEVEPYARAVRATLQSKYGIADPRYVVDTSRNGNQVWDTTWCNPKDRRIGVPPATSRPARRRV